MEYLSDEKLPHLPAERFFIVRGKSCRGDVGENVPLDRFDEFSQAGLDLVLPLLQLLLGNYQICSLVGIHEGEQIEFDFGFGSRRSDGNVITGKLQFQENQVIVWTGQRLRRPLLIKLQLLAVISPANDLQISQP